jgi:hypothetical protein
MFKRQLILSACIRVAVYNRSQLHAGGNRCWPGYFAVGVDSFEGASLKSPARINVEKVHLIGNDAVVTVVGSI